jgi:hypothetical protein
MSRSEKVHFRWKPGGDPGLLEDKVKRLMAST